MQQQSNLGKEFTVDHIEYNINDDGKTISLTYWLDYDKIDVYIPRSVTYQSKEYTITSISQKAFCDNSQIKTIKFAEDSEVQTIGESSFQNSVIESITFPPHLTKICKNAFSSCKLLKYVTFPSNSELTSIGDFAFILTGIECFTIPSKTVELGEGFISKTKNLNKYTN